MLGVVLAFFAFVAMRIDALGLRVQHTGSLPIGIYQVIGDAPPAQLLRRGAIGLWCLPVQSARWAAERGYLHPGRCPSGVEPLAKVVLATSGDTVDFDARGVRLNGRMVLHTEPLSHDAAGRALTPAPYGRYKLRTNATWVWSPYSARSFDSRYLGPMPLGALVAVVRPIWTINRKTLQHRSYPSSAR